MFAALTVFLYAWLAAITAQAGATHPKVVKLPNGEVSQIPSPDGKWTLTFECPSGCKERKLWIEENGIHTRRFIKDYERSLSISWAPDSLHFFVNDAWGSDGENCSVYEAVTLNSLDVGNVLLSADANAKRFLNAGHSYLRATHWVGSRELIVLLFGHFDDPPLGGFTLRYQVDLDGRVRKLSQKNSEEEPR